MKLMRVQVLRLHVLIKDGYHLFQMPDSACRQYSRFVTCRVPLQPKMDVLISLAVAPAALRVRRCKKPRPRQARDFVCPQQRKTKMSSGYFQRIFVNFDGAIFARRDRQQRKACAAPALQGRQCVNVCSLVKDYHQVLELLAREKRVAVNC